MTAKKPRPSRIVWAIVSKHGNIDVSRRKIMGERGTPSERVVSMMGLTNMGQSMGCGEFYGPLWLTKREAQRHCASWERVVKVRVEAVHD